MFPEPRDNRQYFRAHPRMGHPSILFCQGFLRYGVPSAVMGQTWSSHITRPWVPVIRILTCTASQTEACVCVCVCHKYIQPVGYVIFLFDPLGSLPCPKNPDSNGGQRVSKINNRGINEAHLIAVRRGKFFLQLENLR